jgi:hypothetical protein
MAPRLGKYTTQLGGSSLPFKGHAASIHYTFYLFMLAPINYQVRCFGEGVYVVQASWSMEDHGSVRRVSLGGR